MAAPPDADKMVRIPLSTSFERAMRLSLAKNKRFVLALAGLAMFGLAAIAGMANYADRPTHPVVFSAGHETDPRDGGRPVALIAAALGVKPEVFRAAFRGVTLARDGR